MCFYDSERIRRKQQKYEKLKAYAAIRQLENKGLSDSDVADAIDILLKDDNTEFQSSVLLLARSILDARKEAENVNFKEDFETVNSYTSNDNASRMRITAGTGRW